MCTCSNTAECTCMYLWWRDFEALNNWKIFVNNYFVDVQSTNWLLESQKRSYKSVFDGQNTVHVHVSCFVLCQCFSAFIVIVINYTTHLPMFLIRNFAALGISSSSSSSLWTTTTITTMTYSIGTCTLMNIIMMDFENWDTYMYMYMYMYLKCTQIVEF